MKQEFLTNMQKLLGERYPAFLESMQKPPKKSLRINPLKLSAEQAAHLFPSFTNHVPWEPLGFYTNAEKVGTNPYYLAGLLYSQEASAMSAVRALDPKPGDMVLDLCAAPGGKSTQIAGCLQGKGLLVSNELIPSRAKILCQNLERLGVSNCIVTNESPQRLEKSVSGVFDKILVDAPCSGEGMFRKDPAASEEWAPKSNEACAARQLLILSSAAKMLRPGGRLVYSTCTFSPVENEHVVLQFLKEHPEFALQSIPQLSMLSDGVGGLSPCRRIYPHLHPGEGHFVALLEKSDGTSGSLSFLPQQKEDSVYTSFAAQTLSEPPPYSYYTFGSGVHLFPGQLPDLRGLKTMMCGIYAGSLEKGRFVPSHALAMALSRKYFAQFLSLSPDDPLLEAYLRGHTFPCSHSGWCAVGVGDYPLGWGKGADGILKNHYPKGLRKK